MKYSLPLIFGIDEKSYFYIMEPTLLNLRYWTYVIDLNIPYKIRYIIRYVIRLVIRYTDPKVRYKVSYKVYRVYPNPKVRYKVWYYQNSRASMDGWMDGWMEVKAILRIAYSNQLIG